MKRPPKGSTLLGEGCGRSAYLQPDGRVFKLDLYPGDTGCKREAQFYERVRTEAPHLLKHLATIHKSGKGWLIQDYVPHRFEENEICTGGHYGVSQVCPCGDSRMSLISRLFQQAGLPLRDIHSGNYGRLRPGGWPKIFDMDWCMYDDD